MFTTHALNIDTDNITPDWTTEYLNWTKIFLDIENDVI